MDVRRRLTGFVSHYDCSRHDTGWGSPDHQGRLPGIMRAVYADMLTLFGSLKEIEGRHAGEQELLLAHTPEYLAQVREWMKRAVDAGEPVEIRPGLVASPATWEASIAAVGTTLRGVDAVVGGEVTNAFCAVRPSAADAGADEPGRLGFLNQLMVATKSLLDKDVDRVLVVAWGRRGEGGSGTRFAEEVGVRHVRVDLSSAGSTVSTEGDPESEAAATRVAARVTESTLDRARRGFQPDIILLSAEFDQLGGDQDKEPGIGVPAYHASTVRIRDYAEAVCGGRIVSVLGGGASPRLGAAVVGASPRLGAAVVGHVRALAGIGVAAG